MSEIQECKVGLLHDPKPYDRKIYSMDVAIQHAMTLADYKPQAVYAVWFEGEPIYIFTAGLMFKLVGE